MNVWEDAGLAHGDLAKEPVQLFIVSDGKLKVSRDDPRLLVYRGWSGRGICGVRHDRLTVSSRVAGQFDDLGDEVL